MEGVLRTLIMIDETIQCKAITRKKQPCSRLAVGGSTYCRQHQKIFEHIDLDAYGEKGVGQSGLGRKIIENIAGENDFTS